MYINLQFAYSISEACREKLQAFSDTILAQGITENRPPRIDFHKINRETYTAIGKLQWGYSKRQRA